MSEEDTIPDKSWARAADPISKIGYMDGASEGQNSAFQSSFDDGYKLGFNIGLELGYKEATIRTQNQTDKKSTLTDPRKINCQACLYPELVKEDVVKLHDKQKQENDKLLDKIGYKGSGSVI